MDVAPEFIEAELSQLVQPGNRGVSVVANGVVLVVKAASEVVELAFTCVGGEMVEIRTALADFGGDGVPAMSAVAVDGTG